MKIYSKIFSFFFLISLDVCSQEFSPYFLSNNHNDFINYLINSRRLEIQHPLSQPYTVGMILENMSTENDIANNNWSKLLKDELVKYKAKDIDSLKKGHLLTGADFGIMLSRIEKLNKYLYGSAFLSYTYKNLGFYYKFDIDERFKSDSLHFGNRTGKLQTSLISRTSSSYIQWNLNNLNFFIGRMNRNYGIMDEPSLIWSDNSNSFDHFTVEFSNKIVKFTSSFTRLDDIYGYDIRRDSIPVYDWYKRYFAFHRLNLSFSKKLKIAISESIIFGGTNQTFMPIYVNPANIFFSSKMSDRKGYEEKNANEFVSFEVYYKPISKATIFTQVLIDDMDFTKNLRETYPDRLGILTKFIISDVIPQTQFYTTYSRLSNWTYNSFYTFGNYISYGKSLGYPKHGVENINIGFDCFKFFPFSFSIFTKFERQREQNLEQHFIAKKTDFPIGISQYSNTGSLEIIYFPNINIYSSINFEFINYKNYANIHDNNIRKFNIILNLKVNLFYKR